uniref:Uncharacterized protein n=1 Tax=Anguilla anguilla TaxID=7936 RepID=A0A0E9XDP0_ANGAN
MWKFCSCQPYPEPMILTKLYSHFSSTYPKELSDCRPSSTNAQLLRHHTQTYCLTNCAVLQC